MEIDWVVRQFAKLDIQLEVRATDNNQFQDKVRKGKHQVFWTGWNADYPGRRELPVPVLRPQRQERVGRREHHQLPEPRVRPLFEQMKTLPDGPEKQALIDKMVHILQVDAPWSFGFFPYCVGRRAALGLQLQARHPDPRPRALPAHRRRRAPRAPRPTGTSRCGGRCVLLTLAFSGLLLVAVRSFKRRERMNARGEILAA